MFHDKVFIYKKEFTLFKKAKYNFHLYYFFILNQYIELRSYNTRISLESTCKCTAVNRLATCSITYGEISTLNHKILYNPMKNYAFIMQWLARRFPKSLFSSTQRTEVLACYGTSVRKQLKDYPAHGQSADLDVEEHPCINHGERVSGFSASVKKTNN